MHLDSPQGFRCVKATLVLIFAALTYSSLPVFADFVSLFPGSEIDLGSVSSLQAGRPFEATVYVSLKLGEEQILKIDSSNCAEFGFKVDPYGHEIPIIPAAPGNFPADAQIVGFPIRMRFIPKGKLGKATCSIKVSLFSQKTREEIGKPLEIRLRAAAYDDSQMCGDRF